MKCVYLRPYALGALLVGLLLAAPAPAAVSLDQVYAKIDQSAAGFRGIGGDLKRITHTAVINDTSEEAGTFLLKRSGREDMRLLIDFTKPAPRSVSFQGKIARIFYPKIKTVQEYDLGKHKDLVEQFLLLGFGTNSRDLRSRYNIKLLGENPVAGQTAAHLELTPKSSKVLEHIKKIELWVSTDNGNPLRQKFYQGGGDYIMIEYGALNPKPGLADGDVELKLPSGVKVERPQK